MCKWIPKYYLVIFSLASVSYLSQLYAVAAEDNNQSYLETKQVVICQDFFCKRKWCPSKNYGMMGFNELGGFECLSCSKIRIPSHISAKRGWRNWTGNLSFQLFNETNFNLHNSCLKLENLFLTRNLKAVSFFIRGSRCIIKEIVFIR